MSFGESETDNESDDFEECELQQDVLQGEIARKAGRHATRGGGIRRWIDTTCHNVELKQYSGRPERMSHRKLIETKQQLI